MSVKLFTKKVGGKTFAFGNLALRRFTEAMGCAPTIINVHSAFSGATQIGAIIEMIKAGYEQGSEEVLTEREASAIVDSLTEQQQADLLETFFSSIVGEPFGDYLKKIQDALDATDPETKTATPAEADESKNGEASPKSGATSKPKRSEK